MHLHPITPAIARRMLAALKNDPEALACVEPLAREAKYKLGAPITSADLAAPDSVFCIGLGLPANVSHLPALHWKDGFAVEIRTPCVLDPEEHRALLAAHDARLSAMRWQAPKGGPMLDRWRADRMPWRFVVGRDEWLDVHAVFRACGLESPAEPKHQRLVEGHRRSLITRIANAHEDIGGAVLLIAWAEHERARVLTLEAQQPAGARIASVSVAEDGTEEELIVSALEGQLIDEAVRALNARGKNLAHGRAVWRKLAAQMNPTPEAA